MSIFKWRAWAGAAVMSLAAVLPVRAELITFDDTAPTLFSGSSVTSGGFRITSEGTGFSGIDSPGSFVIAAPPKNANSNFLFMLNNDGILFERESGESFALQSFDLSFVSPVPGGGVPGASPGRLGALGFDLDGLLVAVEFFDLPSADAFGEFSFKRITDTGTLNNHFIGSIFLSACAVQEDGSCPFDGSGLIPAQFALDNLYIPEPNAALLALTALGLMAIRRRRSA